MATICPYISTLTSCIQEEQLVVVVVVVVGGGGGGGGGGGEEEGKQMKRWTAGVPLGRVGDGSKEGTGVGFRVCNRCGGGGRDVPDGRISMQKCHTHFPSLMYEHTPWSASKFTITIIITIGNMKNYV